MHHGESSILGVAGRWGQGGVEIRHALSSLVAGDGHKPKQEPPRQITSNSKENCRHRMQSPDGVERHQVWVVVGEARNKLCIEASKQSKKG